MGLGKTCCSGAILWDHRSDLIVDFCRNFFVLTHLWGSSFLCVGKKKTTSPFLLFLFSCYFLILIWWAEFIQWREHWLLEVRKGRQWVCLFWEQWTRLFLSRFPRTAVLERPLCPDDSEDWLPLELSQMCSFIPV